jgi:hypothetical protein
MTIIKLKSHWMLLLLLLGVCASGCCQAFPLLGENNCPTDARRIYLGAGEEAVRRCPCGPDRAFYGHKPTSWRTWPEGWRYGQYPCSPQVVQPATSDLQELPAGMPAEFVNPNHKDDGADIVPPTTGQNQHDLGESAPGPVQPQMSQPAPMNLNAAQIAPANSSRDARSAADVINSSEPIHSPAYKKPTTPGDEMDPPPFPPGTSPKPSDAGKGAGALKERSHLVSESRKTNGVNAPRPAKVPQEPLTRNSSAIDEQSIIKSRIAELLSHSLVN